MSTPRALAAALWLVLPGCAGSQNNLRPDSKEADLLTDSAKLYWEGVRWGDAEKASNFLELPPDRLAFKYWLEDEREKQRVVDVVVLQVDLGPELADDTGPMRRGTVHVRVEGYTLPAQVLKKDTLTQGWYRSKTGWWLEWDREAALFPDE